MLTFDNLVLDFTPNPKHLATWTGHSIILRVANAGNKEWFGLFEILLWAINHESVHGVINKMMMPRIGYFESPEYFEIEWPMAAGIDYINGLDVDVMIYQDKRLYSKYNPRLKKAEEFFYAIVR